MTDPVARSANRLIDAASPYLLQHAHNPVDWYPWGPEALKRARAEQRPIFLSIGYAACHWCHVMERESFENDETAALMNQLFVNIKVDREERPDLDDLYMASVQMLTGSGGWPMSVFLTPELKPFFAGTYFPPEDRWGRPGFPRLLEAMANLWRDRRADVLAGAERVTEELRSFTEAPTSLGALDREPLVSARQALGRSFDETYGGFGSAPKFPHAMAVRLLLRANRRDGDRRALEMATRTLDAMAAGGIYDHLGGGFHRYATDERWLTPHFEKMLYDQSLLVVAYLEAFQVTGEPRYAEVVRETCDYVLRDLRHAEGGFFSSEDADSEGVEGRFYVWTHEEIASALALPGDEVSVALFRRAYGVDEFGNFEGRTILSRVAATEELAAHFALPSTEVETRLDAARARLFALREGRARPFRDEKVITSWNALMISALVRSGRVLDEPRYVEAAARAAEFLLRALVVDGRLQRVWRDGRVSTLGFLDDHAFLVDAWIDLYESGFERRWLDAAIHWADIMVALFRDERGGYFSTNAHHEVLVARLKSAQDGSIPSGNSVAASALSRLGRLTGRPDLEKAATTTLQAFHTQLERAPGAFHQMLLALELQLGPREEIVVAGPRDRADTRALLRIVDHEFVPGAVVSWTDGVSFEFPLHEARTIVGGKAAAYFCIDSVCRLPLTEPEELRKALRVVQSS